MQFRRDVVCLVLLLPFLIAGCWWRTPPEEQVLRERSASEAQAAMEADDRLLGHLFASGEEASSLVLPYSEAVEDLRSRGEYLVRGAAACGSCHGARAEDPESPLSGSLLVHDRYGEVFASNITPDKDTGIGTWNVWDIARALRSSLRPDGSPFSADVHRGFRWMADRDAKSIAVYILSQPAVRSPVERRELSSLSTRKWGVIARDTEVKGYVPVLAERTAHQYGEYLVEHLSSCGFCHTPDPGVIANPVALSGRKSSEGRLNFFAAIFALGKLLLPGETVADPAQVQSLMSEEGRAEYQSQWSAPVRARFRKEDAKEDAKENNVPEQETPASTFPPSGPDVRGTSPSGLQNWQEQEIVDYLSHGVTPQGKQVSKKLCPWSYYSNMTPTDKKAVALYLKRL